MEFKKAINKYGIIAKKSNLNICLTKGSILYFNDSEKKTISLGDLMEDDWCGCAPDFTKFDYCSNNNLNEKFPPFVIINTTKDKIPYAKGMSIICNADNVKGIKFSDICPKYVIFPKNLRLTFEPLDSLFDSCYSLLGVMNMNIFSGKEDLRNLFCRCVSLSHVDTQFFNKCKFALHMFLGCTGLTNIDTTNFRNVVDASYMFCDCTGLKSIDLTPFASILYTKSMFNGCENLNSVIMPEFFKVGTDTFNNCKNLVFIEYRGTKKSWYKKCVSFPQGNGTLRSVHVKCTDGMIDLLKSVE